MLPYAELIDKEQRRVIYIAAGVEWLVFLSMGRSS